MLHERWLCLCVLAMTACDDKEINDRLERKITKEAVEHAEQALAAGADGKLYMECGTVERALPELPAALADRGRRACHVEGPRLVLKRAIAEVEAHHAKHPTVPELACSQLFVPFTLATLAAHPPEDAELRKLQSTYMQMCPEVKPRSASEPG
jgi:hypothetical protein